MRIFLDQDEVLAQFVPRVLEWFNEDMRKGMHGRLNDDPPLLFEDITSWQVTDCLGPNGNVFLRNYLRYPNFYQDLDPVPGAVEGVRRLIDQGHDVMIVSAVPKFAGLAYEGKLQWIRKHMPFFNLDNFCATKRKDVLLDTLGVDMLLDDGLHNLIPWAKKGGIAVAMDRPWNRILMSDDGERNIVDAIAHRVRTWEEFLDLIDIIDPSFGDCLTRAHERGGRP